MTTPNIEELIAELRYVAKWAEYHLDKAEIVNGAADTLQSQAERIKTLEDQISRKETTLKGWLKENGPGGWIDGLRSQLEGVTDTLTSTLELLKERDEQLAEIEKTEPYCFHWVDRWGCNHYADPEESIGPNAQPLFTRPMPAQDVMELALEEAAQRCRLMAEVASVTSHGEIARRTSATAEGCANAIGQLKAGK